ncbi:hypothetical protein HPY15_05325 [Vibrio cholerae]|uniref:hypothetical protein n=1 Tax=Vibrio cholerae TaxID=666 RepID=UPI00084155BE|nr:hypothetical protein [Vibrio cholerae]QKU92683.1 hypothetical protein HPY15_05325 [Vibrio cholerae]HDL9450205.1 hypothetical protein [Vibrio cholerae]
MNYEFKFMLGISKVQSAFYIQYNTEITQNPTIKLDIRRIFNLRGESSQKTPNFLTKLFNNNHRYTSFIDNVKIAFGQKNSLFSGNLEKDVLRADYSISLKDRILINAQIKKSLNEYGMERQKEKIVRDLRSCLSEEQFNVLSSIACQNLVTFILNYNSFIQHNKSKFISDSIIPDLSSAELAGKFISESQKFIINIDKKNNIRYECSFNTNNVDIDYIKELSSQLGLKNVMGINCKIVMIIDNDCNININDLILKKYQII